MQAIPIGEVYPIDAAEFRRWLETFPAEEQMAERACCDTCPVAKFLISVEGFDPVRLSVMEGSGIALTDRTHPFRLGEERWRIPGWVSDFIEAVDAGFDNDDPDTEPVTAGECLRLLDEIERKGA